MTLIAALQPQRQSILFGDLLISGPERPEAISIPAIGDIRNFFGEGSGWSIVGLLQKVAIVADNCAMGWAGSPLHAYAVLRDLRAIAASGRLTAGRLKDYFDSTEPDNPDDTSFVGFVEEAGRCIPVAFGPLEVIEGVRTGRIYAAGSGTASLNDLVTNFNPQALAGPTEGPHFAATVALSILGTFLMGEGSAGDNLRHFFGGGYELALHTPHGFRKLDVTYVVWQASRTPTEGTNLSCPRFLLKQQYDGDLLLIRSAMLKDVEIGPGQVVLDVANEQRHVVRPAYTFSRPGAYKPPASISFDSSLSCHVVLINDVNKRRIFHRIESQPDIERRMLRFEDGGITFNLSAVRDFVDAIRGMPD
jgi:hypothetical protein